MTCCTRLGSASRVRSVTGVRRSGHGGDRARRAVRHSQVAVHLHQAGVAILRVDRQRLGQHAHRPPAGTAGIECQAGSAGRPRAPGRSAKRRPTRPSQKRRCASSAGCAPDATSGGGAGKEPSRPPLPRRWRSCSTPTPSRLAWPCSLTRTSFRSNAPWMTSAVVGVFQRRRDLLSHPHGLFRLHRQPEAPGQRLEAIADARRQEGIALLRGCFQDWGQSRMVHGDQLQPPAEINEGLLLDAVGRDGQHLDRLESVVRKLPVDRCLAAAARWLPGTARWPCAPSSRRPSLRPWCWPQRRHSLPAWTTASPASRARSIGQQQWSCSAKLSLLTGEKGFS